MCIRDRLTIDSNKVTPAIGAGLHVGDDLRFDAVFAYVIASTVEVDPAEARVSQIVPVLANPVESPDIINGGTYASRAVILGLGVEYAFDRPRVKDEGEPEMDAVPAKAKKPAPEAAEEVAEPEADDGGDGAPSEEAAEESPAAE